MAKVSDRNKISFFIYGKPKTRKTMWATQPVADNFAVTVLDIENNIYSCRVHNGFERINRLELSYSPSFQSPSSKDGYIPALAFMQALLNSGGKPFVWCEDTRNTVTMGMVKPEYNYCIVSPNKMCHKDVLVLDSWTALLPQVEAAKDLGLMPDGSMKNPYQLYDKISLGVNISEFGKTRDICDTLLNTLVSLRCTVVVIGHEYVWEKKSADQKSVIATYSQPMSATGAHGQTMSRWFNMSLHTDGDKVSTIPNKTNFCGSSVLPPEENSLDKYTIAMVYNKLNMEVPSTPYESEAFVFKTGAEILAEHNAKPATATTQSSVVVNVGKPLPTTLSK